MAWRIVKVWGIRIPLPFMPEDPRIADLLKDMRKECAQCKACRNMLKYRQPIRHISHLIDKHGRNDFEAIEVVEDIYNRLYRRNHGNGQKES